MSVSMETRTEVTYHCTLADVVLCEETRVARFKRMPNASVTPAKIREFAAMLNDIAIKMESLAEE